MEYKLIKSIAEDIYKELGPGRSEVNYQKALVYGLSEHKDIFTKIESEVIVPIYYKGYNCGNSRCDIILNDSIILELKSLSKSTFMQTDSEVKQLNNYLNDCKLTCGLLINFSRNDGVILYYINYSN